VQVGVLQHHLEKVGVGVDEQMVDLGLFVGALLALLEEEDGNGHRQADHGDDVARQSGAVIPGARAGVQRLPSPAV
jgi:hypothetical protein